MSKHAPPAESHEKVPLWIISFADMITLLLSFFVMLQTMAHTQDAKLLGVSRESFRRAIAGFGMPDLVLGKQPPSGLDYHKLKYPTEEGDDTPGFNRIIDADDERIRKAFEELKKKMETKASDIPGRASNVIVTPITFAGGRWNLDEAGKSYLRELAGNLGQENRRGGYVIVLGVAGDGDVGNSSAPERQVLEVSARRAQAACEFLQPLLCGRGSAGWSVSAVGAGRGDRQMRALGAASGRTSIVIAIAEGQKANG